MTAATVAARGVPLGVVSGLFLASIALRPQLLAIGPLLPSIRDDLALSASAAGLLTTIPVLCMGLFAPLGPRIAARLGPRAALAACITAIAGFGVLRAVAPAYPFVLGATFGIGVAIGIAGAIPSMIVSQHLPSRPALGTGAYAGGIVAGSTVAAAVAVPLTFGVSWRISLVIISAVAIASVIAWLVMLRGAEARRPVAVRARRLPWRRPVAWLLVVVFGLQSLLFYGVVAWVPNAFVERGWGATEAGLLVAVFNGIGLVTTIGIPLVADRFPARRPALVLSSVIATGATIALVLLPDVAYLSISVLGLALGAVFPLALTLPLDVTDDPGQVGSVAALMLLGGYIVSSTGPLALGAARDVTGNFTASLWMLAGMGAALAAAGVLLSPARLRVGVRDPLPASAGRI